MTLTLDAHFDLLMDVQIQREKGRRKVIESDYLARFKAGGVNVIVAAIFIDDQFVPQMALQKALCQISALYAEVDESPDQLMICYNPDDIKEAHDTGKTGFMLSLEGAEPLGKDITLLRIFYELGVRSLGLVWSRRNETGNGSRFKPIPKGDTGGLTDFGLKIIREAERLGITIDVSHLNDEGFLDVLEVSTQPIIASHSNSRTLCSVSRNLTNEQINAIASKKGVIGVNAVSIMVADNDTESTVEKLADHIDYLVRLAGIQHVGIGLDLCDDFRKYVSTDDLKRMPRKPFDVIKGHQNLSGLIEELKKRSYMPDELDLLTGQNFLRVFAENRGYIPNDLNQLFGQSFLRLFEEDLL